MPPEDGRTAATLKTTLSCSVIASAFAAIAVEAAIAVFIMDKRQHLAAFMAIAVIAALTLIISSVVGAIGVAKVYKPGYSGTWDPAAGKGFFSTQALFGGLGLLLVVISAFCGNPKPEASNEPVDYQGLKVTVGQLQRDVAALQASLKQEVSARDKACNTQAGSTKPAKGTKKE